MPPTEAALFLGIRQLWLSLRRREAVRTAGAAAAAVAAQHAAGVSAEQVSAWLRRQLGCHPAASCEELQLDGAAPPLP